MPILVTGVRQKMASIEVREKFALTEEEVSTAIQHLLTLPGIEECAILTTCNRSEIYANVTDTRLALESIERFYKEFKGFKMADYRAHLFVLLHEDAVIHLFRVASGLDSLILGEGQILGQVKDTLALSQQLKSAGPVLDKMFKAALTVGKRVRTETGIADKDVSVSRAAYEMARQQEPKLFDKNIALIGGGKMASILMASLKRDRRDHSGSIAIVNRSEARLASLTEKYGFPGHTWEEMDAVIAKADVLFVATGAPHLVLGPKHFQDKGDKLVIDIAVPRNVDPRVGEMTGIRLFNTDDLAQVGMGFSPETQEQLKQQAQEIIDEELTTFLQWQVTRPVLPTIAKLREKIESIRKTEASCACPVTGSSCSVIDNLTRSLINKILHDPTVQLKDSRNMQDIYMQAQTLSKLFNLEETPVEKGANKVS